MGVRMSATEETLALLRSIDASLKLLVARAGGAEPTAAPSASDDALCDGQYGDPIAKAADPRDWTGEPIAGTGRRLSECPPAYLDLLAKRLDYFASKEPDEKKAGYNRLDARRARAWSARLRNGWQPAAAGAEW